ncbi:MAG: hypothetical protein RMI79_01315 [Nitrososphaerota archaeon]|nr:hypothetical protein [Nitrososphaerota archaeon]
MTQISPTVEARNFANFAYIALLAIGALIALWGFFDMLSSFLWFVSYLGYWAGISLFSGLIRLAIGGLGIFFAFTVWKPKILDSIDQGRYADAHKVASDPIQIIVGILCGVIPGILLILTQQKLTEIVKPLPPPPPPPAS